MEESKLRTHRRARVGSGGSPRRGAPAAPAASSHVIDLRGAKSAAPSPPAAKPVRKSRRQAKVARRPLAAPNQSVASSVQPAPAAQAPAPPPVAEPLAGAPALSSSAEPSLPARRFWPAFWRFLVLLVILGLLVIGGVYLYINYYRG